MLRKIFSFILLYIICPSHKAEQNEGMDITAALSKLALNKSE